MPELRIKADLQKRAAISGLFLLFSLNSGCSYWPSQIGGTDAERLTRVIHAENARLKDLVVQLRSRNEDMSQRSLDDAARIARLDEENQVFRTSLAAYQSERERMAKSFQNLQQQVQVALSDRSVATTSAETGLLGQGMRASSKRIPPPAGRFDSSQNSIQIPLAEWFAADSAILDESKNERLKALSEWIKVRMKAESRVSLWGVGPQTDRLIKASSGIEPKQVGESLELPQGELDRVRGKRLWESIQGAFSKDIAAQIRFDMSGAGRGVGGQEEGTPSLVIKF
ncbi:MAG: hypothetical protein WCJ40_11040 [Planctomycetota bacterium]